MATITVKDGQAVNMYTEAEMELTGRKSYELGREDEKREAAEAGKPDIPRKARKPQMPDLELVVGHFLHYLSNEVGRDGISPRLRFYGSLPIQAKMLYPDVSDEILTMAVREMVKVIQRQSDIHPNAGEIGRAHV